ncbi:MAG: esterase family protein, partial [Psychromonas sp.]|nr:esterase family protein [Psychromonas sp.]
PDPTLHLTIPELIKQGKMGEVIVVAPENSTNFTCCGYDNSEVQGNWLDFICEDLPQFIESNYRCLTGVNNRALMGHSSGGDAVLRLALKKPGYFNTVFAMSCAQLYAKDINWLAELYEQHKPAIDDVISGTKTIEELDVYGHILLNLTQQVLPDITNAPVFCKWPLQDNDWRVFSQLTAE